MRRGLAHVLIALLIAGLAAGCGAEEVEFLDVTGHWSGAQEGVFLRVTLSEGIDGEVMGVGTLQRPGEPSVAIDVEGVHVEPDVSLLLTAPDHFAINYFGEFEEEERILGALTGDGFESFPLILVREVIPEDEDTRATPTP